jgi:hypothetical protein
MGKRFPLLPYIENISQSVEGGQLPLRERLADGEWLVVLYRAGCPRCREILDRYRQNVEEGRQGPKNGVSLAVVAMPPVVSEMTADWCEMGKLRDDYQWFLKTPRTIHLRNGVVEPGKDDALEAEAEPSSVHKLW